MGRLPSCAKLADARYFLPRSDVRQKEYLMPARRTLCGIVGAAILVAAPVLARADAASGRQLAERWCVSCHIIGSGAGQTVPQGPPTFRSLARGKLSADAIRAFLTKPHGKMPDLSLTRSEIDSLTDYIESLR